MLCVGEHQRRRIEIDAVPEALLADADYYQVQMDAIVGRGTPVLIPRRQQTQRHPAGLDGGPCAFMRRVLDTDHGGGPLPRRQRMVEPVFADAKFNRRDRFQRSTNDRRAMRGSETEQRAAGRARGSGCGRVVHT
jgi:hypothetical protein